MRLIGLNGFKESGKDTTFDCIRRIEEKGNGTIDDSFRPVVQRAGFADKLKIMAAKALGFTDLTDEECIQTMNECKEMWDFSIYTGELGGDVRFKFNGRQYLQWFGGEARGVFGENFWIDQVLPVPDYKGSPCNTAALGRRYPDTDILVITDVRYENEAQRIKDLGGEVWEILKPGLESDGHGSEIPLHRTLVDKVIQNDGTIDDLRDKIAKVL